MKFLKKNKLSIFFLLLSLIILSYTHYKSYIVFDSKNVNYYKQFYYLSSFLIFFSITSFFINSELRKNISLSIFSIIFILYILEVFLSFYKKELIEFKTQKKDFILNKNNFEKFDRRSKIQVYTDEKKEEKNLALNVPSYLFLDQDLIPLSGESNKKTLFCNESGKYIFYNSDRYGFNNNDDNWDKEEIKYLIVGDSFAQGTCVDQEHSISGILSNYDKNSGVLNLGSSGNGPLLELASLREYSTNLKIKKIIWLFYDNDILNLAEREKNNKVLIKYLNDENFSQNLILKQNLIDTKVKELVINKLSDELNAKKKKQNIRLVNIIKLHELRILLSAIYYERKFTKQDYDIFKSIIISTKYYAEKKNAEIYFVYLPDFNKFDDYFIKKHTYSNVKKIVKNLNIKFIDIYSLFLTFNNPKEFFPFGQFGHYNEEGYRIISEFIYKNTNK